MPSMESMMEMLMEMAVFGLVGLLFLTIFQGYGYGEFAFGDAYPVTQRLVSTINIISASPYNETAVIKIVPANYNVTMSTESNYIEAESSFLSRNEYGLFLFKDIEFFGTDIDCKLGSCGLQELVIEKKAYGNGRVEVFVGQKDSMPNPTCVDHESTPKWWLCYCDIDCMGCNAVDMGASYDCPGVCCCEMESCGDGLIDLGEQCDDGNIMENDGCTGCMVDPGYTCTGEPSICT